MWTANGWFGFNRLNLDEARTAENTKEPEENVTEEAIDEAATVDHARYMRSHGKKARDTGHPGTWMFTNKEYGDVNQNNNKEFHSARGSFADAKKSAQSWAKEHGHHRVYVMEDVEQIDEVSKRTLGSYATKALNRADIAARMSHSDSDEMGKIAAKRTAGVKKAVDKLATKKADATRIKTNVDKAREAARNRYTDKDDQGKAYYAAQKGISKIRESVELDESMLTSLVEGTVYHGPYELTSGNAMKGMGEGEPTHVHAHQRKMNKLGVPQHDKDDYGNTVLVHVKDTRTGDKTVHHVYQRGFTEPGNKEGKKVVSVRTVGQARPKSAKHNDVIKNYLSGKHFKNLQEQWIEDAILTTMVEEALAAKRSLNETRIEKDLQDHEPRIVHGYKGMKQRPFSKKFKNQEHMEKWMDSESSADHDIHTIEKA